LVVSLDVGIKAKQPLAELSSTSSHELISSHWRHSRLTAVYIRLFAAEFLAVALAAYGATALYHATFAPGPSPIPYTLAALIIAGLVSTISAGFRHYVAFQRQPLHFLLWSGVGATALAFSLFLSALFLLKISEDYSRGAFVFQVITVCLAVCLVRTASYLWVQASVRADRIEARRVVLIGGEHHRSQVARLLNGTAIRSITSAPFPFDHFEGNGQVSDRAPINDDHVRNIIRVCRLARPDDVLILAAQEHLAAAPELARRLSELPTSIHIVPVGNINIFGISRIAEVGNVKTLQIYRPPLSLFERCVKRTFDVAIAGTALLVLTPLLLAIAIAIKLDSRGRILFRQERHGYNNETIRILKFRTMAEDVSAVTGQFAQAKREDERVTALGRILRRTNIDELPQLVNVLAGDMSIVGPRPHAIDHNKMFEDKISPYYRRHNMKPGITGWAQVNGCRGETDTLEKMERRIEYDLNYIDNWSFLFDVKIVLLTLFSKKAYANAY
jgi:Undecaprenyl-phosphate glucose phosphotransferase